MTPKLAQKAVSWLMTALVALALGTGLAALGAGPAEAQQKKKLIFLGAGSVPSIIYLPVYVADKAGLFAEEALEVETRYGRGGPLTVQVTAAGGADIAHIVWQPLIAAYAKGVRGRFIYQTFTGRASSPRSRRIRRSGIRRISPARRSAW